jgi:HlyD family secretion protein
MKPRTWIAGAALTSLVVAGTYFRINASTEQPALATAGVSRGGVVETVEATGTVQPVDLVEVGYKVTGSIQSLGADFNDRVEVPGAGAPGSGVAAGAGRPSPAWSCSSG